MKQNLPIGSLPLGIALTAAACAAYRIPAVPDALDAYVTPSHVDEPFGQVTLTLDNCPITLSDTTQGAGVKLLDFPLGLFKVHGGFASLTFKTTSVLANSLNASSAILWALGTATQSTLTLAGPDGSIMPAVSATSSATVNVANTATIGRVVSPALLNGAGTAADVYLNVAVPTANDIDAVDPTTVTVSGSITLFIQDMGATTTLANASRMPTASLWANCPWDAINRGEVDGVTFWTDFVEGATQAANIAAAASVLPNGMAAFTGATAGSGIATLATTPYGVVQLQNATDNETTCLMALGGRNQAGNIVFEAGKRVWFETRVKTGNVTDSKYGFFIGFGEEALCATVAIVAAAGTLTDKDLIGFWRVEGDGDKLDLVHNTASGGGVTVLTADAVTVVADTWIDLGMYCDGTTVYFYANGVAVGSVALAAANVPDGEEVALYFAMTNAATEAATLSVDWIKVAEQRA
jgi:hypothetical protein